MKNSSNTIKEGEKPNYIAPAEAQKFTFKEALYYIIIPVSTILIVGILTWIYCRIKKLNQKRSN